MKMIGLCGGSGSGKSTVSLLASGHNVFSVNTDEIYRMMTSYYSECVAAIHSAFGDSVVNADGALNRTALASIVFFNKDKHTLLNAIAHRFVLDEVRKIASKAECEGFDAVLVDAPLLFESGFDKECDAVIAVVADTDIRIDRIIKRDGITKEQAVARINAQLRDEELKQRADFYIENNGDIKVTEISLCDIINKIIKQK